VALTQSTGQCKLGLSVCYWCLPYL